MRLPEPVWRLLLLVMVIVFVGVVYRDVSAAPKAIDYCAMANLRSCKLDGQGTWVTVTTPEGGAYILIMQNGRVVQTQKIQ